MELLDQIDFYKNFYDFSSECEELAKSNKEYCAECCTKNCSSCSITESVEENKKQDWFDINLFYAQFDEYEAAILFQKPDFLLERDKNREKEAYEKLKNILDKKKEADIELSFFEKEFKAFLKEREELC